MKLKEYIENLQNLLKEHPEAEEYDVVYSEDDEGNRYNLVYFEPSIGYFDKDDREFCSDVKDSNAVCIN